MDKTFNSSYDIRKVWLGRVVDIPVKETRHTQHTSPSNYRPGFVEVQGPDVDAMCIEIRFQQRDRAWRNDDLISLAGAPDTHQLFIIMRGEEFWWYQPQLALVGYEIKYVSREMHDYHGMGPLLLGKPVKFSKVFSRGPFRRAIGKFMNRA